MNADQARSLMRSMFQAGASGRGSVDKQRTFTRQVVQHGNPWTPIHDGTVKDETTFAEWELGIPQYGCQCRRDYAEYKANNPPSFESAESIWLWGVDLHNYVNSKLGKPEVTIKEARKIWRRDDANTENSRPDLP